MGNLARRKRRRRIEDACATLRQSDEPLEVQQLAQNERAGAFQSNHATVSILGNTAPLRTLRTPPAQAMIQRHGNGEVQEIGRRKRGGFQHTQSTANNIYFRNSVHVLESTEQSDTILR